MAEVYDLEFMIIVHLNLNLKKIPIQLFLTFE